MSSCEVDQRNSMPLINSIDCQNVVSQLAPSTGNVIICLTFEITHVNACTSSGYQAPLSPPSKYTV